MNSQQLLFINFLIVLILVLFFVFGRSKPKQPTVLVLKPKVNPLPKPELKPLVNPVVNPIKKTPPQVLPKIEDSIFFVYNGHEWEAFEVLGLPCGTALKTATAHYQNLIKTSDASTFEFYDLAYTAILKSQKHNK